MHIYPVRIYILYAYYRTHIVRILSYTHRTYTYILYAYYRTLPYAYYRTHVVRILSYTLVHISSPNPRGWKPYIRIILQHPPKMKLAGRHRIRQSLSYSRPPYQSGFLLMRCGLWGAALLVNGSASAGEGALLSTGSVEDGVGSWGYTTTDGCCDDSTEGVHGEKLKIFFFGGLPATLFVWWLEDCLSSCSGAIGKYGRWM